MRFKLISNLIIIIAGILLLQYHAIQFWYDQIGWIGIVWSFLIEYVNFWLYINRRNWIYWFLGFLTTILLLVAPLYAVSNLLFTEQSGKIIDTDNAQMLRSQIQNKGIEADRLLKLIESGRIGFKSSYDKTQIDIEKWQNQLIKLQNNQKLKHLEWQTYLVVVMQMIAIVVFYIVLILSILSLPVGANPIVEKIKEAKVIIEGLMSQRGKTVEQIAKEANIGLSSVNGVLHYSNELRKGIQRFSFETAEELIKRLKRI